MRKIVLACASFKGTLSSREAGSALARGVCAAGFDAQVVSLADGGEGLVEALGSQVAGARFCTATCRGPLLEPVDAVFAMLQPTPGRAHPVAVLEMAASSGLPLLREDRRDVQRATTLGVGDQILAALAAAGAEASRLEILLGIGGSATNDGGAGMAQALGARLLNAAGNELPPGGAALKNLSRINVSAMHALAARIPVTVACDVENPLCGPRGASRIYGPQKGATPADVIELDAALERFAEIVQRDLARDVAGVPGAGAAGGLGAGCLAFLNATLKRGIELVLDALNFDDTLKNAALVITGEGRLDDQTLMGKAPAGVAARARRAGVRCVAVGGGIDEPHRAALLGTFDAVESLSAFAGSVDAAKRDGAALLERLARERADAWINA